MLAHCEKFLGRPAQTLGAGLCAISISLAFVNLVAAQDQTLCSSVQLKVGKTRQIAVLADTILIARQARQPVRSR